MGKSNIKTGDTGAAGDEKPLFCFYYEKGKAEKA